MIESNYLATTPLDNAYRVTAGNGEHTPENWWRLLGSNQSCPKAADLQSTASPLMLHLQKAVGILLRHALDVSAWRSKPRFKATGLRQLLKQLQDAREFYGSFKNTLRSDSPQKLGVVIGIRTQLAICFYKQVISLPVAICPSGLQSCYAYGQTTCQPNLPQKLGAPKWNLTTL